MGHCKHRDQICASLGWGWREQTEGEMRFAGRVEGMGEGGPEVMDNREKHDVGVGEEGGVN